MTEWAVSLSSKQALARARKRGWKTYSKGGKRYSTSASKTAQKASKGFRPIRRGGGAMIIASLLKGLSRYVKRSTMAERGVGRWSGRKPRTSIKDQRPIVVGSGTGRAVNKPQISSGGSNKGKGKGWSITKGTVIGGIVGVGLGAATAGDQSPKKKPKKASPEPVATEKNTMGMKFSAAPPLRKKQTFSQAFKQAYAGGKGKDSVFTWRGKSYVAVTKEDVKKAGAKNLREYLNKKKKKK